MTAKTLRRPRFGSGAAVLLTTALTIALSVILTLPSNAAVRNVPTEYATIQAAVNACSDGDVVAIAPGTYSGPGNRDIQLWGKVIRVEGTGGRDATIVDCGGTEEDPHGGFIFGEGTTKETTLAGLTIRNAYSGFDTYSAVDGFNPGAQLSEGTLEDCRVVDCESPFGSIVHGAFDIVDCVVENCSGGSALSIHGSSLHRVEARGNHTNTVVHLTGSSPQMDRCSIIGNAGTGISYQGHEGLIQNTVITGNVVGFYANNDGGSDPFVVRGCTISANIGGLTSDFAMVQMERCVLWDNLYVGELGIATDWTLECCIYPPGSITDAGFTLVGPQILEDPLFCDGLDWTGAPTTEGDYSVRPGSPCLPENNPCGELIGALGLEGCDPASAPPGLDVPLAGGRLVFTCPLPAREELRFRVDLAGTESAAVAEVVSPTGRVVASKRLDGGAAAPGAGEYTWCLAHDDGGEVPSGVYFLRVRSEDGGVGASAKFVWVRS